MNLINYNKNLFQDLSDSMIFDYDEESSQYTVVNDSTPGIFGLGDTKEDAIEEYLSGLRDMILVNDNKKNETCATS